MASKDSPQYSFEDLSPSSLEYSETCCKLPLMNAARVRASCDLGDACAALFRKNFIVLRSSEVNTPKHRTTYNQAQNPMREFYQALPQMQRVVRKTHQSKAASRYFQRKCKSSQSQGLSPLLEQPQVQQSKCFRSKLKSYTLTKWMRNHRATRSTRHTDTTFCQQLVAKGIIKH